VALDSVTLATVRDHRKRQMQERLAWGPLYQDNDLVFCAEDGSPIHPEAFTGMFERQGKAAGLPRIRLHDLRHTYASLALGAGVHPKVVSERLGHASISITLDTYSHAIPALQEEAAERIAAVLSPGGDRTAACALRGTGSIAAPGDYR
jgi:integrase